MMEFLAQAQPRFTAFGQPAGSTNLWIGIIVTLLVGFGLLFAFIQVPPRFRRPIVATFTFVAGLFFVLVWLWPKAQGRQEGDLPLNAVEGVSFWLEDAVGRIGNLASILTAFLLGLGVFSLLRIHLTRLAKKQQDWGFSIVLLLSMLSMTVVGYWAWYTEKFSMKSTDFNDRANWVSAIYARDFLFDGMLQKMDAAMFSIIAFYIMSAAYRAFRVRSVEATILLAAALIMMFSLLSLVDLASNTAINSITGGNPDHFMANFTMSEIAGFVRRAFQSPSIRAIDFGIGVGALAMGIRLWLSLEKGGTSA